VTPALAVGARLLGGRTLRRLVGCGCAGAAGLVALPLFVLVSALSGLLPASIDGGANQVDSAAGTLIGSAEPLRPGSFTVTQGFGCTAVGAEPAPPPGYTCPPDGARAVFVRFHTGIDLGAARGDAALAVTGGTVQVLKSATGFGLHVLLLPSTPSTRPVVYLYGHLSAVTVSDGETVVTGETIGAVGSTGNSTGPHLHFEVDVGGVPVNPCATFPQGYLVPAGVSASGCLAWAM
jgi:murein DD-endopeptidase MepM/ murein hydrolase activator NlpD